MPCSPNSPTTIRIPDERRPWSIPQQRSPHPKRVAERPAPRPPRARSAPRRLGPAGLTRKRSPVSIPVPPTSSSPGQNHYPPASPGRLAATGAAAGLHLWAGRM
jgi:hypothetical protein